jgi:hypothetical protein
MRRRFEGDPSDTGLDSMDALESRGLMPALPDAFFSLAELELKDPPADRLERNIWVMIVDDKITMQLRKIYSHVPRFTWQYDPVEKTFAVTILDDNDVF